MTIDYIMLGQRIGYLRRRKDLSQEELAESMIFPLSSSNVSVVSKPSASDSACSFSAFFLIAVHASSLVVNGPVTGLLMLNEYIAK